MRNGLICWAMLGCLLGSGACARPGKGEVEAAGAAPPVAPEQVVDTEEVIPPPVPDHDGCVLRRDCGRASTATSRVASRAVAQTRRAQVARTARLAAGASQPASLTRSPNLRSCPRAPCRRKPRDPDSRMQMGCCSDHHQHLDR